MCVCVGGGGGGGGGRETGSEASSVINLQLGTLGVHVPLTGLHASYSEQYLDEGEGEVDNVCSAPLASHYM